MCKSYELKPLVSVSEEPQRACSSYYTAGQLSGKDHVGTIISILPRPSAWESQPLEGRGFRKDSGTNNKIMKESPGGVSSHVAESGACSWNSVKTLPIHVPSELPGLPHGVSIPV